MEQENIINSLLELIERPAFCVCDGKVLQVNQAARQRLIAAGTDISDLLGNDIAVYESFNGGTQTLTVNISGTAYNAQVSRAGNMDVFVLDSGDAQMQAIALAAQNLRGPLNSVMTVADYLSCDNRDQMNQLQRGLSRLHRIVCNMSDAYRYQQDSAARKETTNLTAVFDECMEAIRNHLNSCSIALEYSSPNISIWSPADREMLERAIYNLISNAVKFADAGSTLQAKLVQKENLVSFSLQCASNTVNTATAFSRYLRQPGIEDSRFGIGLGMPLVRAIAAAHGGTVLIDHPEEHTTRITMTLEVVNSSENLVRSSIRIPTSNYAGDRDRGLLELSEILPADAYQNKN